MSRKGKHNLSEINIEQKTAACSHCGPVTIYVSRVRGKIWGSRCSKAVLEQHKAWRVRNRSYVAPCRKITKFDKRECEKCRRPFPYYCLDRHHKDHNHDNNSPENIAILCACCHRVVHHEEGYRRKG